MCEEISRTILPLKIAANTSVATYEDNTAKTAAPRTTIKPQRGAVPINNT
jgi:hypothetical protein